MDQNGKKILCCDAMFAKVTTYQKLGEMYADSDRKLKRMNSAADQANAIMEEAFLDVLGMGTHALGHDRVTVKADDEADEG